MVKKKNNNIIKNKRKRNYKNKIHFLINNKRFQKLLNQKQINK